MSEQSNNPVVVEKREEWSSRWAFYFAAVGSAVGFGNVWRFPALSVEYGGGAFFIPYILALILIGYPILVLEIGFGQYFKTGDVNVFGSFHPRFRGVGVASVCCGFMLTVFYSMLIAWCLHAFFDSFGSDDPWGQEGVNGTVAIDYFVGKIVGQSTLPEDSGPTRLVWTNVGYSFLVWVMVFFGTAFGIEWTGRITYVTMGIPIVLLFVFLGRAVTLEGQEIGVEAYIGGWDLSVLTERGDVWSTAVSQIFFSLGVTFGIMTAFGSYCPDGEPVALNSLVIAGSNSMFSLLSGFAVFAALGHLSYLSGIPLTDLPYSGFALVFGTWPVVLGTLPGGEHWVRLLFLDLFLLGIDSAFALTEAVTTVVKDTRMFQHTAKWKLTMAICVIAFLLSIMYATDAGLIFLDVIDFYINFVMLLVGFFECFSAGWVYGIADTVRICGTPAFACYLMANFGSVLIACGIWFGVPAENGAVWGGFVALFGIYALFFGITVALLHARARADPEGQSLSSLVWAVSFKNVFDLKALIEPCTQWIPSAWCILMKQFIPQVLIVIFVNLAQSETEEGFPVFGHYGGYVSRPYQVMGCLTFLFTLILFTVGFAFPNVYQCLALPEDHTSAADEVPAETSDDTSVAKNTTTNHETTHTFGDGSSQSETPSCEVEKEMTV